MSGGCASCVGKGVVANRLHIMMVVFLYLVLPLVGGIGSAEDANLASSQNQETHTPSHIETATTQEQPTSRGEEPTTSTALYCEVDSDCIVKDVHNCCGYYPGCVNRDYVPDIEAVVRRCAELGIASVCGYPDNPHCQCREHSCVMYLIRPR